VLLDLAMERRGYRESSRQMYIHLAARFARNAETNPGQITECDIRRYISALSSAGTSPQFLAQNISALRVVFDKFGNQNLTNAIRTPRRPRTLPTVLSRDKVRRILCAAGTVRDRILLGLVYGCGLKASEICALRWRDMEPSLRKLHIAPTGVADQRIVALPTSLVAALSEGKLCCHPDEFIFPGSTQNRPITTRTVSLILRRAVLVAGIEEPVTCMTLRHSYAVHALESGTTIREVQVSLGHRQLLTTGVYMKCLPPCGVESPLDTYDGSGARPSAWPPPESFAPARVVDFGQASSESRLFASRLRVRSHTLYFGWRSPPKN